MILNRNSWHFKLYHHYLRQRWGQDNNADVLIAAYLDSGTNLCDYVNSIFLKLPFLLLRNWAENQPILFVVAFSNLLFLVFGGWEMMLALDAGLAIMFILACGMAGIFYTIHHSYEPVRMWFRSRQWVEAGSNKSLLRQWVEAKWQRVCPLIKFSE